MLAICIYIYIYFVLCIHSLGATRFWKGVMQGSWSLETTVLKPLLLGYTLHLLTRYNGDGDRLGSMAAAEHSYQ